MLCQTRCYSPIGEVTPRRTDLGNERQEHEEARSNDRLLIDNVELLGDGGREQAGAEHDGACLRDESGGRGHLVDQLGRLFSGRRVRGARHATAAYTSSSQSTQCRERTRRTHARNDGPRQGGDRLGPYPRCYDSICVRLYNYAVAIAGIPVALSELAAILEAIRDVV